MAEKRTGLSWCGRAALCLTAAFLLFIGGYFAASMRSAAQPYQVTAQLRPTQAEMESAFPAGDGSGSQEAGRPDSLLPGEQIDVNTASALDLTRLPGIGESKAQAIVDWREANGPFRTVDQLMEVKGIGEGILEGLRPYVTAGAQGDPAE